MHRVKRFSIVTIVEYILWGIAGTVTIVPGFLQTAHAQSRGNDKLLETETLLLQSLSARAVAYSPSKLEESNTLKGKSAKAGGVKAARTVATSSSDTSPEPVNAKSSQAASTGALSASSVTAVALGTGPQEQDVSAKDRQIQALQREVQELRGQLSMAEVEVTRLSAIMDAKTRASLDRYNLRPPAAQAGSVGRLRGGSPDMQPQAGSRNVVNDVRPPSPDQNLEVATIVVNKAELRLGPGMNHSALMPLPKGSRLAVEMRQGEWLRVFAPSGERAWIHTSLVRFGETPLTSQNVRAVSAQGVSGEVEEEAFRRMNRGMPAN